MKTKDKFLISLLSFAWLSAVGPAIAEEAKTEDTPAAAAEPEDFGGFTGNYLSGQFARLSGDIDAAIHYLRLVHRKDPQNTAIAEQLQGLLLLEGKVDEAMALTQPSKVGSDKDQLDNLLLVLREIKNHHDEVAAGLLATTPALGSAQLWKPLISAWVDVGRKKLDKPLTIAQMGGELAHAAPLVNYHLALINSRAGFTDEAAKNFKAAIEDPKNPPMRVMQLLLQFYQKNGQPEILTPVVKQYQDSHPDADAKKTPIPVIVTAQDGVAEVLFTMGGIMMGAGITNDAVIYMQLALYVRPDFSEASMALADAYNELQVYNRANALYEKIPIQDAFYPKAQLHIAVNLERMGKMNEALARLDKMVHQGTGVTEAWITKGDLLRIHSRFKEAADAYTQALKHIKEPTAADWPVLFARGACYDRQGNWPAAEKDLRQALEIKPDQPDVLNYLGYGLLERGKNLSEARAMIEKAVKERPDDAQIVDSMGWALYLMGNYAGASSYIEKAVELLPGDPTVNDHLGDVYWRLGRKTEARYQWERSLTFSPEAKLADSLHRKLKQGLPPNVLANSMPSASAAVIPPNIH